MKKNFDRKKGLSLERREAEELAKATSRLEDAEKDFHIERRDKEDKSKS